MQHASRGIHIPPRNQLYQLPLSAGCPLKSKNPLHILQQHRRRDGSKDHKSLSQQILKFHQPLLRFSSSHNKVGGNHVAHHQQLLRNHSTRNNNHPTQLFHRSHRTMMTGSRWLGLHLRAPSRTHRSSNTGSTFYSDHNCSF